MDTSRLLRCLVIGAVTMVGLAACGDGGEPSNPATPPASKSDGKPSATKKGCELLTQDEAAAAAGNAVKPGKMLGVVCIWEPQDLDNNANVQVSVAFVPIGPGADAKQMCAAGLPGIPNAKPLPGIGNEAYWDYVAAPLGNSGSLHVCVDQGFVDTAAIGGRPEAELKSIALSLAETAMSRL